MPVGRFGEWSSALSPELVARGAGRHFSAAFCEAERLRWLEYRSDEGGRGVVVQRARSGETVDVTPPTRNVRSRVHEYGGGACWCDGDTVFFSDFGDSRLYRQDGLGAEPQALTPQPQTPHALRYADGCVIAAGATVLCVRERHEDDGTVSNELVALPADGSAEPRVVVSGTDFVSSPRPDPDGGQLAWLTWDHPQMPWDGTQLWLGALDPDGAVTGARCVAGGTQESVFQPEWSPEGVLHFCSDRNGWWNLQRLEPDGTVTALTDLTDGEIGHPSWVFGMSRYAFLDDGRIACVITRAAVDALELLHPGSGALEAPALQWTAYDPTVFTAGGGRLAFAAQSPQTPATLVVLDPASGTEEVAARSLEEELDATSVSVPQPIVFPTGDGDVAHAFYYPPASAEWTGPADERPPLRVICHGGPTAHSGPALAFTVQFYAQRGIGVLDVNHRGSSGFGRAYRQALNGRWGDIDWRDCVAAARHLAEAGRTDPDRTWIKGGSAGGYVVLCALAFEPEALAAGVCLYGVADAETLAQDTHKFESRYLDTLIGPYPERADLYRERSPIHAADRIARPLLVLQGTDDEVVPPSQSEVIVAALDSRRIPHAYILFEGEGHGFRKAGNIRRALEAELSFAGQVFGFAPADELAALEVVHLVS